MHGKYPFPEATATTQILVSGQKGGNQARPLIFAGLVGGLYDFMLSTFGWWSEVLTTRILPFGDVVAEKASWCSRSIQVLRFWASDILWV